MTPTSADKLKVPKSSRPKSLGARIRVIRIAWGWTQARLAIELGVPQQSISAWEHDKNPPMGSAMANLLRLFGLSKENEEFLTKGTGFTIPASPIQVSENLRIIKGGTFKGELTLPPGQPGQAWVFDLDYRDISEKTIADAVKVLRQAARDGRSAWILIN